MSTSLRPAGRRWVGCGRIWTIRSAGLPRDDAALTSLITELVMRAESEPASEGAMQLNFDLLEQQRLEDGIAAAQKAGDYEVSTRLSGERAELTDRIAHAGVVS